MKSRNRETDQLIVFWIINKLQCIDFHKIEDKIEKDNLCFIANRKYEIYVNDKEIKNCNVITITGEKIKFGITYKSTIRRRTWNDKSSIILKEFTFETINQVDFIYEHIHHGIVRDSCKTCRYSTHASYDPLDRGPCLDENCDDDFSKYKSFSNDQINEIMNEQEIYKEWVTRYRK